MNEKKNTAQFMRELANIKDVTILIGLTKLLGVEIDNEDKSPRPFEDVILELCEHFASKPRNKRRELLDILKKANKVKDKTDPINKGMKDKGGMTNDSAAL